MLINRHTITKLLWKSFNLFSPPAPQKDLIEFHFIALVYGMKRSKKRIHRKCWWRGEVWASRTDSNSFSMLIFFLNQQNGMERREKHFSVFEGILNLLIIWFLGVFFCFPFSFLMFSSLLLNCQTTTNRNFSF